MKKLLLIIAILSLIGGNVNAQITLTQTDMAVIGQNLAFAQDSTCTTSIGKAGANQTWDLSSLKNQKVDTTYVVNPKGTTAAGAFPTSNLVEKTILSAIYKQYFLVYFNLSASSLLEQGFYENPSTGPLTVQNIPPATVLTFPTTYNTSNSITSVSNIIFPYPVLPNDSEKIQQTDIYTLLVDGWGTVKTPTGTYDCLRQRRVDILIDSTFLHNASTKKWNFVSRSSNIDSSYIWWGNNKGASLAQITFNPGSTKPVTATYLLSSMTTGIEELNPNEGLNVYPNPFNKQATISLGLKTSSNVQITLYNSLGQVVSTIEDNHLDAGNYKYETNVQGKGIYFLRTLIDGVPSTKKLIQIE